MNSLHGGEFEVAREAKEAELQGYVCLEILCIEIRPPALGDPVGSPSGQVRFIPVREVGPRRGGLLVLPHHSGT